MKENLLSVNEGFKPFMKKENLVLLSIALLFFLLEFIPNGIMGGYGYFIDEFYYIACAKHLALGYVDHPPLSIFILFIVKSLFGTSTIALRFLPALFVSLAVYITGLIARKLGGGLFAQVTASFMFVMTGVVLVNGGFYSMNAIEIAIWVSTVYLVLTIVRDDKPVLWLPAGILIGLGLENKHTIIVLAIAILAGLLLTKNRKYFLDKWLWLGMSSAVIIFIPNIIWQISHNWASIDFYRNAGANKYANVPLPGAFLNLIMTFNPVFFPFWAAGLYYILIDREGRKDNLMFGLIFLIIMVVTLFAASSRPDRMAGIFPVAFAGFAVFLERIINKFSFNWIKPAFFSFVLAGGIFIFIPICVPVLPAQTLSKYGTILGMIPKQEKNHDSALPQWFSDRFGWNDLVSGVADAYYSLPEDTRKDLPILTGSYAYSGSIDLLGKMYGLPDTISDHNSYYFWGYGKTSCEKIMVVGDIWPYKIADYYRKVDKIADIHCSEYSMGWRINVPVFIASDPVESIAAIWPKIKFFF